MSADDLLAGPLDNIDIAHLAAEHRAACDEIHQLRAETAALRAVVRLCVTGSSPYGPSKTGEWAIEHLGYEDVPVTEAQALAVRRALQKMDQADRRRKDWDRR